ncbi:hypothetical protein GRF29_164g1207493 [Pseudopithomyces chartarum]|uniref:Uncharacterized protein n=1 Tax=Pseudopithomyces chartarum TaxID=1892770 RepID=A0AAN6RE63_9PLEO|nr:hypothetical protein GRF29_164g1207493 [Pseudopithomyces chartarum]
MILSMTVSVKHIALRSRNQGHAVKKPERPELNVFKTSTTHRNAIQPPISSSGGQYVRVLSSASSARQKDDTTNRPTATTALRSREATHRPESGKKDTIIGNPTAHAQRAEYASKDINPRKEQARTRRKHPSTRPFTEGSTNSSHHQLRRKASKENLHTKSTDVEHKIATHHATPRIIHPPCPPANPLSSLSSPSSPFHWPQPFSSPGLSLIPQSAHPILATCVVDVLPDAH